MNPSYYLSIRQPFAASIIHGTKDVENWSWIIRYRGRLWIHASKSRASLESGFEFIKGIGEAAPDREALAFGAIIGSVEIYDCVTRCKSPWFVGEYGFLLRNAVALRVPVPMKANARLQRIDPKLLEMLRETNA